MQQKTRIAPQAQSFSLQRRIPIWILFFFGLFVFFYPEAPLVCAVGGPVGSSVVVGQPLCFRGLDLHLSLLGLGLIHLPPVGPLEEATLGEEGARLDHRLHTNGTDQSTACQLTHRQRGCFGFKVLFHVGRL